MSVDTVDHNPRTKTPGNCPRGVRRGFLGAPRGAAHGVQWLSRRARNHGHALCKDMYTRFKLMESD
eukprot:7587638-Lingulodinium_polyedra.AAC.1